MFVFLYDLTMKQKKWISLQYCSAKNKNLHLLFGVSAVL